MLQGKMQGLEALIHGMMQSNSKNNNLPSLTAYMMTLRNGQLSASISHSHYYSKRSWRRSNDQTMSKFQARISVYRGTDFWSSSTAKNISPWVDDDESKSYVRPLLQLETVTSVLVIRSDKQFGFQITTERRCKMAVA